MSIKDTLYATMGVPAVSNGQFWAKMCSMIKNKIK